MSPDWSAKEEPVPYAKLDDPQSLNLYGYVGNNPLSRADADGHCGFWDCAKTTLDVAGFIPVVGDVANAASGAISLAQGHYGEAALSFAAAVPVVGVLGEIGKAAQLGKDIEKGVELTVTAKEGWTAAQTADAAAKIEHLNGVEKTVTEVERSSTSAASRYKQAGGVVDSAKQDVDHMHDLGLGGKDTVGNMKSIDKSVNRSLGAQIGNQTRNLPKNTKIDKINFNQ
jgi:hypothetical protein